MAYIPGARAPAATDLSDFPSQTGNANKVLKTDGSGTLSWTTNGGGGSGTGGITVSCNTYANRPTVGNAGSMFFGTDCPVQWWLDDGVAWHPMIMGQVIGNQPKAASNFTGVNNGTATLVDRNGALHYSSPAGQTTSNVRMFVESLSSSTAYVEAVVINTAAAGNTATGNPNSGIIMRESGTGKIFHFMIVQSSQASDQTFPAATWVLQTAYWASNSSLTAYANMPMSPINGPLFMRIERSGSNLLARVSSDATNWTTVKTVATATAFTTAPDQVGIAGIAFGSADFADFNLTHYISGS